jgi:N6-adenosine-specific RNA methylase IME4
VAAGEISQVEAMRQMKRDAVHEKVTALPKGRFRVLYADPPWKYGDERKDDNVGNAKGAEKFGPAERHYPPLSLTELCSMDVKSRVAEDAVLFLWSTSPLLPDALEVIKAWGFTYKTSFVWDKVRHNFGHYNSVRHEFLLVATRGSCKPDSSKLYDSVVQVERTSEHSRKPEEFRQIIDDLYRHGSRLELFARGVTPNNWKTWGGEK